MKKREAIDEAVLKEGEYAARKQNQSQAITDEPEDNPYGSCSMCHHPFNDDSEFAYRAVKYSSDGVHKRGMMFFCKNCRSKAKEKYSYGEDINGY